MNVPCPQCGKDRYYTPKSVVGTVAMTRARKQRCKRCGNDARREARRGPRPDAVVRIQCLDCGSHRDVKGSTLSHNGYANYSHSCRACANKSQAGRDTRVGDTYRIGAVPVVATHVQPGSEEKILILQARVAAGEQLHHPDEPTGYSADVNRVRRLLDDIGDAEAEKAFRAKLDAHTQEVCP